nr:hypothetical protein Itr_chr06CG21940 [Ipomoea trifida]
MFLPKFGDLVELYYFRCAILILLNYPSCVPQSFVTPRPDGCYSTSPEIEPVIVIAFMAAIAATHQLRNNFKVILHLIVVFIHRRRSSSSGIVVVREMSTAAEEMVLVGRQGFVDVVGVINGEFLGLNLVVKESVCNGGETICA